MVPRSRFYILLWYLVLHFAVVLWYLVLHLLWYCGTSFYTCCGTVVPPSTLCCGTVVPRTIFCCGTVVPPSTLCCGTVVLRTILCCGTSFYTLLWYLVLHFAVVPCSTLCSGTVVPRSTLWCGTVVSCSTLCCGTSFCTFLLAFNSCGLWTVSSHPYPLQNELMKQGMAHSTKASLGSCTARLASRRLV